MTEGMTEPYSITEPMLIDCTESQRSDEPVRDPVIDCIACQNGLPFPRKCNICCAPIHHLDGCSFPLDETGTDEGYGEKRICRVCNRNRSLDPEHPPTKRRKEG